MSWSPSILDRAQKILDMLEPIVVDGRQLGYYTTPEYYAEAPDLIRAMLERLRELEQK